MKLSAINSMQYTNSAKLKNTNITKSICNKTNPENTPPNNTVNFKGKFGAMGGILGFGSGLLIGTGLVSLSIVSGGIVPVLIGAMVGCTGGGFLGELMDHKLNPPKKD